MLNCYMIEEIYKNKECFKRFYEVDVLSEFFVCEFIQKDKRKIGIYNAPVLDRWATKKILIHAREIGVEKIYAYCTTQYYVTNSINSIINN